MEQWVEQGQAPDGLVASVADRRFSPGAPKALAMQTPDFTMPLCKFPQMARYDGKGDKQRASSWTCRAADSRLLSVGESGRQAGELN
jgi:feruloyl esterase